MPTIRKTVSLHIQESIMKNLDRYDIGSEFWLNNEFHSEIEDPISYSVEYDVFVKRPYCMANVRAWNADKSFWGIGFSKCIGVHKQRPPDKWDPMVGVALAVARAATDVGKQIQEYEDGIENGIELETEDVSGEVHSTLRQSSGQVGSEQEVNGSPIEVEIKGFEKFKTYLWHGMTLARVSDYPEHVDALNKFMHGQTRPIVDGADPNDYIYLRDFENFLSDGKLFWD